MGKIYKDSTGNLCGHNNTKTAKNNEGNVRIETETCKGCTKIIVRKTFNRFTNECLSIDNN